MGPSDLAGAEQLLWAAFPPRRGGIARVGEGVLLSNACLDNPAGVALCLDGTEVAADIVCDGLTVAGEMRLTGTKIAGQLSLDRVRLANPGGAALTEQPGPGHIVMAVARTLARRQMGACETTPPAHAPGTRTTP